MLKRAAVLMLSLSITACANLSTQSLFSHYSASNAQVHQALQQGNYTEAVEALPDAPAGDILDGMERGRVNFVAGQYPDSFAALQRADMAVKEQQRQAVIQLSEGLNQAGALLTNDNMITYQPADYELGFMHLYLALNYIHQKDLEGALVEVRRANQVQEAAKKLREAELGQAAQEAQRKGLNQNLGAVLARYPDAGEKLANVQNGYLFYLSGILYEADGDLNSAYIDYKRALAVAPNNIYIANTVLRLATRMQMTEDLTRLQARYGKYAPAKAGEGRVVILDEQGVVLARDGWRLPLWLQDSRGDGVIYNLSLPYYRNSTRPPMSTLVLDDKPVNGSELANVDNMARNSLNEELPVIVVRQALRVLAKDEVRKSAAKNGNELGNALANIFNTLTEQPDTRSWQSLPSSISMYHTDLQAGTHKLSWSGQSLDIKVAAGRTTMVWVSRQGNQLSWWSVLLGES
ncbi:COG3014 family protein [Photobacterium kasasachensis]|uniref:COG3014 family protein n=1 Tax=Photobacterium kasasachensis TaxID=2910240 RepID=UPI003D11CBDD